MEPTKAPWLHNPTSRPGTHKVHVNVHTTQTQAGSMPAPTVIPTRHPATLLIDAEPALPHAQPPSTTADTASFVPPRPRINSPAALTTFLKSATAHSFVAFILALNNAVKGKRLSDPCPESPPIAALLAALARLSDLVDQHPPSAQSLRYGNPAFRDWFDCMVNAAPDLLTPVLPPHLKAAVVELAPYLVHSFGNRTRIDYGTGHETTFVSLLYCLAVLGVVGEVDCQALVTRVFDAYLQLMRKIQTTYWLEPAGSHGVWGLDDYQFLSFLWGASQLVDHPVLRPRSIHHPDVLAEGCREYMYLQCVAFVQRVKKGPLGETSPMLNDISGVPSWEKVNSGLIKMYQAELLAKLPIMQHFLFGSLLPFPEAG